MPSVFTIHKSETYWFKVLFVSVIIDTASKVWWKVPWGEKVGVRFKHISCYHVIN